MRKPKPPRDSIEVEHIRTSEVELIQGEVIEQLWDQHGYPHKWERYAISNYFLVKGVEWRIRSICSVYEGFKSRVYGYDERNHRNLNQLILIQAHDLFNRLIGSRYNAVELGMKDKLCKITVHREFQFQHASGYYFSDKKFDLEYGQNAQYFEIGEGFEPYFRLWRREF